ncbi:MAG: hypothetical protein QW760_07095 [Thermofilaceae archaeon]
MPARIFEEIMVRIGYYVYRPSSKCPLQKRMPKWLLKKSRVCRFLWASLNFVSSFMMLNIAKMLSNFGVVLLEDGIPRIINDYIYALEEDVSKFPYNIIIRTFYKMLNNKGLVLICVSASYHTILERRGICAEPMDYLEYQFKLYNLINIARMNNNMGIIIKTDFESISMSMVKVISLLKSLLKRSI